MTKLTLQAVDNETTVFHELEITDETWISQLEAFCKFLTAQGYFVDKRIAIVEPDIDSDIVIEMFYEQVRDSWNGSVVSKDSIVEE